MTKKKQKLNVVNGPEGISFQIDERFLKGIASEICPEHPFETAIQPERLETMFSQYLAMSQAFPHLQAGSQKELFDHFVKTHGRIPVDVEVTTAVGAFLCADETGVLHALRNGISGLPSILNTRGFHANLLDDDIELIVGRKLEPAYTPQTATYLENLFNGLSNPDRVSRVAMMVAFETHAERMINGLWEAVSRFTKVAKDNLNYFRTHVGGDDPAEAYHVQTTTDMISKLVRPDEREAFVEAFKQAYTLNVSWCRAIANN